MEKLDKLLAKFITELEKSWAELKKTAKTEDDTKVESEPAVELVPLEFTEVRSRLADLSRKGKTDEIRELIAEFGAAKLSEVDPKHYKEIMDRVVDIERGS